VPGKAGSVGGAYGHFFEVEDQINEGMKWIIKKRK
jgi:hypothetical protein